MKVYFNKKLIKDYPWNPFLNPILWNWGENLWDKIWTYDKEQTIEREKYWKNFIQFSKIELCDYVIFPRTFKIDFFYELGKESLVAKQYNKKIIVFYDHDNEIPIDIDNVIVFRSSSTTNSKNEYSLPSFIKPLDFKEIKNWGNISVWYTWFCKKSSSLWYKIREFKFIKMFLTFWIKKTKLTNFIRDSYCIYPEHKKNTLYYVLFQKWKWQYFRNKVISLLKKSKFETNLILRNKKMDPSIKWKCRQEYLDNIYNNNFSLAIRGDGNFSFRLYEIMSAWRIPLFIDTNCKLPFDNQINYKRLFVWIPFDDIENMDIYIEKYLENNPDLCSISKEIRNIYDNYMTMTQFFINMIKFLDWCNH